VPGMGALAERMIAASGAEFLRSTPVTEVRHSAHGIEIVCGGAVYRASAAVMALGINQLKPIVFEPVLSNAKQGAIAAGHGGRSFKLWLKLEGVPAGTLVTGDGSGIEFAFAERKTEDGATLVVAFGLMNELSRPDDPAWVKSQAARLFPNAHVISYDWHNWNDDPFARGTWVAARAGHEAGLDSSNWQPEGKIAFASSDYARDQAGWFEGAVNSGEDASEALLGTL
jgi:monoamine oxidase